MRNLIGSSLIAIAMLGASAAQAQDLRASDSTLAPAPKKPVKRNATAIKHGNHADDDANGTGAGGYLIGAGAVAAVGAGIIAASSGSDHVNSPN